MFLLLCTLAKYSKSCEVVSFVSFVSFVSSFSECFICDAESNTSLDIEIYLYLNCILKSSPAFATILPDSMLKCVESILPSK
jgi:hypothetical protein